MNLAALAVVALAVVAAAPAARLPGVRTPSGNISCFYVPIRPTAHASLLCNIRQSAYARSLQRRCIAPPTGLDWHGFELSDTKRARIVCAGGIMYDPRDKPTLVTLAYGKTWRFKGFRCASRRTGLTCTSSSKHGLFLSRDAYRVF